MKKIHSYLVLLIFIILPDLSISQEYPTLNEIKEVIKEEVDNGRSNSIVIGIIDNGIESYISYGSPFEGRTDSANENTVYEIASVTKVYVSTILADLVLKEKVNLDDFLIQYLPDTLKFSDSNYYKITLKHLATHTSGIPTLLNDLDLDNPDEYLMEMTYSELFAKLENNKLKNTPGTAFEYSNNNFSLLSYIICKITNENLEQLLKKYFIIPFDMNNTALNLNEVQENIFATAYRRPDVLADHWHLSPVYEAAGGLKSSAKDQLTFMRKLFYENSSLTEATKYATQVFFDSTLNAITKIGVGWFITDLPQGNLFGHNGSSTGFKTALVYDTLNNRGVVIMSNSSNDIMDILYYLLDKNSEINKYRKVNNKEIKNELFDQMKGKYMMKVHNTEGSAEIYTKDGRYYISTFEIIYQGDNSFFSPRLNSLIEFTDLQNGKFQVIIIKKDESKLGKRVE